MTGLLPHHQALLDRSGVAPDVAEERGYQSQTTKASIRALGFTSAYQQRTPALAVPLWNVHGEQAGWQIRCDIPRIDDRGKPVKYETRAGQAAMLDAHPRVRRLLGDPAAPLFVTEGVRKGDAAVSRGLTCLSLLGVWSWRGTNAQGGRTALPDWEVVALNAGRPVFIVFDSDVALKPEVFQALRRQRALIESRGADCRVIYLPGGMGADKVGLDDFLAAGHGVDELVSLAERELRPWSGGEDEEAGPGHPYRFTATGIGRAVETDLGEGRTRTIIQPLANFQARIEADLTRDDGVEQARVFQLVGALGGQERRFSVPAREFSGLAWAVEHLGARAIVEPGNTARDHVRAAIQHLSEPESRTVYSHTGWRELGGAWVYLHAGGALGADGPVPGISVELPRELSRYSLPDPPDLARLRESVRRSLGLWEIGPRRQTVPTLAAVWAAPLGEIVSNDCIPWLNGSSGQRKSTWMVLLQNHFGDFLEEKHLPANFTSTGNATEMLLFAAKDALVTINDYCPQSDPKSAAVQAQTAVRLLRAVGNSQGRNRLTADGQLRGEKPPRCLAVVTAEEPPPGSQSSESRSLEIAWARDSLDLEALTRAQRDDRLYLAGAFSGYVRFLAGRMDELKKTLPGWVQDTARGFDAGHGRVQQSAAKLFAGVEMFLAFALDLRAISQAEYADRRAEALAALGDCARATGSHQSDRRASALLREYLSALFTQGRAFLVEKASGAPPAEDAARWGWSVRYDADSGREFRSLRDGAEKLGWVDTTAGVVYLLPAATYKAVFDFARRANVAFPATQRGLAERLDEEGYLVLRTRGRQDYRPHAEGRTQAPCWSLYTGFFEGDSEPPNKPSQSGEPNLRSSTSPESGTAKVSEDTFSHENAPESDENRRLRKLRSSGGQETDFQGACACMSPEGGAHEGPHARGLSLETAKSAKSAKIDDLEAHPSHEKDHPVPSQFEIGSAKSAKFRTLVHTPEGLCVLAEALSRAPRVALDVETCPAEGLRGKAAKDAALDPFRGRVRLLSLSTEQGTWLLDCFAADPRPLWPVLAEREIVGHNLSFDLGFLARLGFEPGRAEDTYLLSKLLHDGEGPQIRHTLAAVAERELGITLPKELQKADWSQPLTAAMREYAARDAEILLPLRERLLEQIQEASLVGAAEIERRCLPAVAWMSRGGVPFDTDAWGRLAGEAEASVTGMEAQLNQAAPAPPGLDLGQGWKWSSPDIVLRVFREVGHPLADTRDETLAGCPHPLAALLREYRAAGKLASSYGRNWLPFVHAGRLRPTWKQMGPESGRMACADPNVQQVPRDLRYRACIAAPPGRALVKADYSQIELRVACRISGDRNMRAVYEAGGDLHTHTARMLLGRDFADAAEKKRARQQAKALNFGLLFGMSAETLQLYARMNYGVELSSEEAAEYRATFFRTYYGLRRWQRDQPDGAIEARTLTGRRRVKVDRYTEKLNTPVQGTAADGLKQALALLWERRSTCPHAFPVIACHDEIVLECDADRTEEAAAWLRQAMLDGMAPLIDPIPVVVEVYCGRDWSMED